MQTIIDNLKSSGLSAQTLAKKSGLHPERIDSILQGSSEPTFNEIRKLSKALKVSSDFLVSEPERFPEINLLFRQTYASGADKYRVDRISYIIGNLFLLIDENYAVDSALNNFPALENTFDNARLLATIFRKIYCDGNFIEPLLHLPRIVSEDLRCILFVTDLGADTDGASAIINRVPFVFVAPRFEPRMLFTLAHELAHILSHHKAQLDFVKIDKKIVELGKSTFKEEAFANAFASELLMPEEGVGITLQTIRKHLGIAGRPVGDVEIIYLSRIYGVSFDVAAKRCEDLNLLPRGGAVSLSDEIRKDYDSAEKRAQELNILERPKIIFPKAPSGLIQAAVDKINKGEISIGKASDILSIPFAEILKHKSSG